MKYKSPQETISDWGDIVEGAGGKSYEELKGSLDHICSEIANKFGVHSRNNHPRKATIIESIANSTCVGCIAKKLSNKTPHKQIDGIYLECQRFAVGILIEELQDRFSKMGHSVLIRSEAETEYGRVDVLIKPTNYGAQLIYGANELIIEVKTGLSISLSQVFRYLLDQENQKLILWRIRNRQVLLFDGNYLKPILMRFMNTCILRGERLLATAEPNCEHREHYDSWSPDQKEIQSMLEDFTTALLETLPCIVKTVFKTLGVKGNDS